MSRIPQVSTPRSQARPPVKTLVPPASRSRALSPSKPQAVSSSPATPRVRTKSIPKSPSKSERRTVPGAEQPSTSKAPALSIKEAIALKRAEAKKIPIKASGGGGRSLDSFEGLEDAIPGAHSAKEENDSLDLGRWSLKETIERARSTGSINLASRSLPCLPSALFEIHLGITPDPLKLVPEEPPVASSGPQDRRSTQRGGPAWFEAQDLQVLKAWSNEIVEIQHEISLFGSLKVVDLHNNKISALPETFVDLSGLTTLDLSHNCLTSLPHNIWALPALTNLNLSHNALTSLSFGAPFTNGGLESTKGDSWSTGGFFGPVVTRATTPLPRLLSLDVSSNKLVASTIDHANLPAALTKVDLSSNPISLENPDSAALVRALGSLQQLKELRLAHAKITDDAFPANLTSSNSPVYPALRILDLEETQVTPAGVQVALSGLKQTLSFEFSKDEPSEGIVRVLVGKNVVKEPWEIDIERQTRHRSARSLAPGPPVSLAKETRPIQEAVKERWEIEAEQGLLTEGGRRRARAAAAAISKDNATVPSLSDQRRDLPIGSGHPSTPASGGSQSPIVNLNNTEYYSSVTQTLTLPPLAPPSRTHTRSFSLATSTSGPLALQGKIDIALPISALPIAAIAIQPFAQTLKTLVLSSRKLDLSVALPSGDSDGGLLPNLEELQLDGCGLGDTVAVTRKAEERSPSPPRSTEALLPLIARLFPNLRSLDLTYNYLTSGALSKDVLMNIILASPEDSALPRKGLRILRLKGNRITELNGFQEVAEMFKGHRAVSDWKLEELDLRDNEISKLPPELGLLPLDVFLVDGNTFRIPQRKIWEREGTKGLLSWLRGRLE